MTEVLSLSARVAEEIRVLLARRQMSRSELSRRLGVSAMWVSDRLRGQTPIGLDDVERIAEVLEVSPAELFPSDVRRPGQPTVAKLELPDRPPAKTGTRGPKGRGDSVSPMHRSRQKRALTADERSLLVA